MNTTQETEFDYQAYMRESTQGPSEINRGTKAREKRREAAKAWISQKLQQGEGTTMTYETQNFKIPNQSGDYSKCSHFVTTTIEVIIKEAIEQGKNKIFINTNLKFGLPMENINKIAGPFVEAWAAQTFYDALEDKNNKYQLINVEAVERLHMADIILQFQKQRKLESGVTAEVDVKATSEDIESSGKSPNITSYARIRTAYIEDSDYVFVILSLKHRVYSKRNKTTELMDGIMEVVAYNAYDLKYLSSSDISYNPALGTGQIQIRDIHYVELEERTTWEFCQFLDQKYLQSDRRSFEQWLELANKNGLRIQLVSAISPCLGCPLVSRAKISCGV